MREGIGFELKFPRQDVHEQFHERVGRGEDFVEEDEADDDGEAGLGRVGRGGREVEGAVEGGVVDEDAEEREDVEEVEAADSQQLGRVAFAPVAELVREDGFDFFDLGLLDQRVVDYYRLFPGQAGEVGVAVRAAFAAVDDEEFGEGKLEAGGERFDLVFEVAGREGREFVEEWDDEDGVDGYGGELDDEREGPEVEEELVAGLLDDFEEGGTQGDSKGQGEAEGFDLVGEEEGEGLFVEAELLLKHKVVVVAEGDVEQDFDEGVGEGEDQRVRYFACKARGDQSAREPGAGYCP